MKKPSAGIFLSVFALTLGAYAQKPSQQELRQYECQQKIGRAIAESLQECKKMPAKKDRGKCIKRAEKKKAAEMKKCMAD